MSLNNSNIVQATTQSSHVFNSYSYRTEDSIIEVQQPGYFLKCPFSVSDGPDTNGFGWRNAIINCRCSDGYFVGQMDNETGTLFPVGSTGGGGLFKVGPSANYFGATAGDISPDTPSVQPAYDRAEATRIRDAYELAHPEWRAYYLSSPDAGVFLTWKDGTQTDLVGQQLLESGWVDTVSAVGVQGPETPQFVDFAPIKEGCIPALYRAEIDNPFVMVADDSGFKSVDGKIFSDRQVVSPGSQGFNVGTATLMGGAGLARLHDNVRGSDRLFPTSELTIDGSTGLTYMEAGALELFPSPVPSTGAGFGNPLDFFVAVNDNTLARSLFLTVPSGNPEVTKVVFRICADGFGSDKVVYDSFTAFGGEHYETFPDATGGNVRFEVVLAEPVLFRRGDVYYVTVFTQEIGGNIVLVGETVPTPFGERFIPSIDISGQAAVFKSLQDQAYVMQVQAGTGISVDSSSEQYPVVTNTGVLTVSGPAVDNTDPHNPVITFVAPTPSWQGLTSIYTEGPVLEDLELAPGEFRYLKFPELYAGPDMSVLGLYRGDSDYLVNLTGAPITLTVTLSVFMNSGTSGQMYATMLGALGTYANMSFDAKDEYNPSFNSVIVLPHGFGFRAYVQNKSSVPQSLSKSETRVQIARLS